MKEAPFVEAVVDGTAVTVLIPEGMAAVDKDILDAVMPPFKWYLNSRLLPFGEPRLYLAGNKEEVYRAYGDIMRDDPELLKQIVENEKLMLSLGPLLTRHILYDNKLNFILNLGEDSSKEYIRGVLNQELGTLAFNEELRKKGYDLVQTSEHFHQLVGPVALLKPLDCGAVDFETSYMLARNTITDAFKNKSLTEFLLGFEEKNKDIFDYSARYTEDQAQKHVNTLREILKEEPSRQENMYQNRLVLFIDTVGAAAYLVSLCSHSEAYKGLEQAVLGAIDELYGSGFEQLRRDVYKTTSNSLRKLSTIPEKSEVLEFYETMWELFDFRILKDLAHA